MSRVAFFRIDRLTSSVGDITPVEGVTPEVKHQLEEDAMNSFLNEMLGGEGNTEARERFRSLFEEYEARETPEAKLVKVGHPLHNLSVRLTSRIWTD